MPRPAVQAFFDEASHTFSYVAWDPASGRAAVFDSVLDYDAAAGRTGHASADALIAFVRARGLDVDWVIDTHVHADHLSAAPYVQEQLGGRLGIGERVREVQDTLGRLFHAGAGFKCDGSQFDHLFTDGERYMVGGIEAVALHTPGHTPACMTHLVGDAAFVGDTLFMPDYGTARCDFPGGDARTLYRSIRHLFALPQETRVFLCHDYKPAGRDVFVHETTVGDERRDNIHVRDGIDEDAFVRLREARDATLQVPALLLPAVQVNMRAGRPPPPEDNGVRYLKIPLDAL
ncbi:MBL fold metallo-hydrolase [Rhodanobacter sp. FW510-R12]|uniref:MBL fold metallo-hydrolase n=1 Tax=unclassified Rhodanobacter TaxID=2621553 RepID=UPI0007A9B260|nr:MULTISPECIES: MBL fold metallo-hydrolase [unclassified Rhodanobacter]KZC17835.1 MBL fold metallo-hydrolase [Rhodanobacter sp. FW104-R8]KZC27337.1 MBL fold metallo-hydrolase [Rhodanobacter sp. FW510-T8]KZC31758.1 MBL fold metallo-hydrolase [Rhodanobacter sp. FW510-R10]